MRERLSRYDKIVGALDSCYKKIKENDDSGCEKCRYAGGNCMAKLIKSAQNYIEGIHKIAAPEVQSDCFEEIYYCGECGTKLKREDIYCRGCGCEIKWYEEKHGWETNFDDEEVNDWSEVVDEDN